MKSADLKPFENNPRIHGNGKHLKKSIMDLGDLSGIVYNVRLKQLVGGHYRTKSIPSDSTIEKHPVKDPTGTVAEGIIILPTGQRLSYREVDWNESKHRKACIQANNQKIQGQWNEELLAENFDLMIEEPDFNFDEAEEFGLDLLAEEFKINLDPKEYEKNKKSKGEPKNKDDYTIEIMCDSKKHQDKLVKKFAKEGYNFRKIKTRDSMI